MHLRDGFAAIRFRAAHFLRHEGGLFVFDDLLTETREELADPRVGVDFVVENLVDFLQGGQAAEGLEEGLFPADVRCRIHAVPIFLRIALMFGGEIVNARDGFFSPRAMAAACFTDLITSSKDFLSIAKSSGTRLRNVFRKVARMGWERNPGDIQSTIIPDSTSFHPGYKLLGYSWDTTFAGGYR